MAQDSSQISTPEVALPELALPPSINIPPEALPDTPPPPEAQPNAPTETTAPISTLFEASQRMTARAVTVGISFANAMKRGDRVRARFMMGIPFLADTKNLVRQNDLDRIFGPKLPPDREMPVPEDIAPEALVGVMAFRAVEYRAIPFLAQQAAGLQGVPTENYDYVITLTFGISGRYETMLVLVRVLPGERMEVAGYVNI